MTTLSIATIVLYLVASVLLLLKLCESSAAMAPKAAACLPAAIAVLLHAYLLFVTLNLAGNLNLGLVNAISLTSWLVMVIILLAAISKPVFNISLLAMPLAAIAILLAMLYPSAHASAEPRGLALELHILLSLVAYSLLTVAAVQSALLAFQDRQIRNKQPMFIMHTLPPLQVMEELLIQIIALGFFLLSLSLVTGVAFIDNIFTQHLSHKIVLSLLAWLVFATLLFGRWSKGWRGQTLTQWTIGGFTVLLLAYFGSKFVLEVLLDRV